MLSVCESETVKMSWEGDMLHSYCGSQKLNHEAGWDAGQPQQQTATAVLKNKMFNYLFNIHAIKSIIHHVYSLTVRRLELSSLQ